MNCRMLNFVSRIEGDKKSLFYFSLVFVLTLYVRVNLPNYALSRSTPGLQNVKNYYQLMTHDHRNDDLVTLAKKLKDKVRLLCMVFTHKDNLAKKAIHVNVTWAKQCTKHVFISASKGVDLPIVQVNVTEEYNLIWNKTKMAFKWAYNAHLGNFDWFFKADDDTYAIPENLRYLLAYYDPNEPWYFGCRFSPYVKQGYMSGGAGYVLSRKALQLLVEKGLTDSRICPQGNGNPEDLNIGKCMNNLNVTYGDSRDEFKRWRYFPFDFPAFFTEGIIPKNIWFWKYIYHNITLDTNCCSHTAISAHYVKPKRMYLYQYLLYHLNIIGKGRLRNQLFPKVLFNN